jgi:hypothetical protein
MRAREALTYGAVAAALTLAACDQGYDDKYESAVVEDDGFDGYSLSGIDGVLFSRLYLGNCAITRVRADVEEQDGGVTDVNNYTAIVGDVTLIGAYNTRTHRGGIVITFQNAEEFETLVPGLNCRLQE